MDHVRLPTPTRTTRTSTRRSILSAGVSWPTRERLPCMKPVNGCTVVMVDTSAKTTFPTYVFYLLEPTTQYTIHIHSFGVFRKSGPNRPVLVALKWVWPWCWLDFSHPRKPIWSGAQPLTGSPCRFTRRNWTTIRWVFLINFEIGVAMCRNNCLYGKTYAYIHSVARFWRLQMRVRCPFLNP